MMNRSKEKGNVLLLLKVRFPFDNIIECLTEHLKIDEVIY